MDNHSSICDWHTEFGMEKSLSPFDCLCQIFRDFDNEALFLAYSRTLMTVTSSDGGATGQREMKRRWQNTFSIVQHSRATNPTGRARGLAFPTACAYTQARCHC